MSANYWKVLLIALILIAVGAFIAVELLGWEPMLPYKSWLPDFDRQELPFHQAAARAEEASPLMRSLSALLTMLLTGVLTLYLMPERIRVMEKKLQSSPARLLRMTLAGMLAALLLALASLGSAMAISTFPLTFFFGGLLFLVGYFGSTALAYSIGRMLFARAGWAYLSPVYALILGWVLMLGIGQLPLIGPLVRLLSLALGVGVALITRFGAGGAWNLAPLLED